jgi:hypothetical protein
MTFSLELAIARLRNTHSLSLDLTITRLGKRGRETKRAIGEMAGSLRLVALALTVTSEHTDPWP